MRYKCLLALLIIVLTISLHSDDIAYADENTTDEEFNNSYNQIIYSPTGDEVYTIQINTQGNLRIIGKHVSNSSSLYTYQTVGFTFTTGKTGGKVSRYIKSGGKSYIYNYGTTVDKNVTDKRINGEIVTTYNFPKGTLRTVLRELGVYDEDRLRGGVTVYMSNIFALKSRKSANENFIIDNSHIYMDLQDILTAKSWGSETRRKLPHYYDMKLIVQLVGNRYRVIIEDENRDILKETSGGTFLVGDVIDVSCEEYTDENGAEYSFCNKYYLERDGVVTPVYSSGEDNKLIKVSTGNEAKLDIHLIYGKALPGETGAEGGGSEEDESEQHNEHIHTRAIEAPTPRLIIRADRRGSEAFDVLKGIPVGEKLYANVITKNALTAYDIARKEGSKSYQVRIHKTYSLTWLEEVDIDEKTPEEGGSPNEDTVTEQHTAEPEYKTRYETVTISSSEVLSREYSYYEISDFSYYIVDNALVRSSVLPESQISLIPDTSYTESHKVDIRHSTVINDHIINPVTDIYINGGTIDGGYSRPVVYPASRTEADRYFGNIKVRNDRLIINGHILLNDDYYDTKASEPNAFPIGLEADIGREVLYKSGLIIPTATQNGPYIADGRITYRKLFELNSKDSEYLSYVMVSDSLVRIHTPVICEPLIYTDNAKHVQLAAPERNAYPLVLSEDKDKSDFSLYVSNFGKHLDIKGYGNRDYTGYKTVNQVRFPFDVADYSNDNIVSSGTWVDIDILKKHFYIPIWVQEGCYEIEFRTIAINADKGIRSEDINSQEYANYDSAYSAAHKKIKVQISGSIENLRLYDEEGYFDIGTVKKLGEAIMFSFDTTGSFSDFKASIRLTPKFYYIDANGTNRREVDIYYIDENFGLRKLIKVGSKADLERVKYYTTGNTRFNMSQAEMKLTALLDRMTYAEFCSQRKSLFYYGGIRMPYTLRTYISNKYIDYINQDIKQNLKQNISESLSETILEEGSIIMRRQRWHGEYYLPENCIITKKGGNVMKDTDIVKGGCLTVNFDIVADNTNSRYILDYVNEKNHTEQGHCSMWENDIIDEMVRLENGNSFKLYPGDLFVYDTSRLLQEEYTREVTH